MRKILLICMLCPAMLFAQQPGDVAAKQKLKLAFQYLRGYNQPLDYQKSLALFKECAEAGNGRAMNAVAMQYRLGMGVTVNYEEALSWFGKAATAGYVPALCNLGLMYKYGTGTPIDYSKSYYFFRKAAEKGDPQGWYSQGYMLYKGFGCEQNYDQAVLLFKKGAAAGHTPSMYFLGLSLRNGYGTPVNEDSAKYWLGLAAQRGYNMAKDELAASEPENAEIAGTLAAKIREAQKLIPKEKPVNKYVKIENSIAADKVEGIYEGYLLKYDWSGKHVVKADKLKIRLELDNDQLVGAWTENDSTTIRLKALFTPQGILFQDMHYLSKDHYNPVIADLMRFEKATVKFTEEGNNTYLSGNLAMFSLSRAEPGKPLFLALAKTAQLPKKGSGFIDIVNEDGSQLKLNALKAYPNPFTDIVTLDFKQVKTCEVSTTIATLDGKVVYSNQAGVLEKGHYTLPIQTQFIPSGAYVITLRQGKKVSAVKVVKL